MDSLATTADLERTYTERRQGLFTLALSITRSADLAEDAVQTAFARLCSGLGQPIDDLTAYVFTAVRNAAIDLTRSRRFEPLPTVSLFSNEAMPDEVAASEELHDLTAWHIDQLPAEQREVLVMRIHGALSFRQIAEVLGEPLPTVASRYRRVVESLRERLGSLV